MWFIASLPLTSCNTDRVYSGALYYCERCKAQVSGQSPNEHYRNCHQPKVGVRFGTSNRAMTVQRSPQTGLFHCPRCTAAFRHPRSMQVRPDTLFDYIYRLSLQDHGLAFSKDKCAKGMPKHRALSGSSGPKTPARQETASTPSSARKSAGRPRRSTYKEESSPKSTRRTAARPLAVPTRTRHVALCASHPSSRADASLYIGPAYQMYHARHVR